MEAIYSRLWKVFELGESWEEDSGEIQFVLLTLPFFIWGQIHILCLLLVNKQKMYSHLWARHCRTFVFQMTMDAVEDVLMYSHFLKNCSLIDTFASYRVNDSHAPVRS